MRAFVRTREPAKQARTAATTANSHSRPLQFSRLAWRLRTTALIQLQRTVGNRAVAALIDRTSAREPCSGHCGLGATAPPLVHQVLQTAGQPLPPGARAAMESRFGEDLGDVRVHADRTASRSAAAVGALAYTVGKHIVFGQGQYAPHTVVGQQLLAHELTHAIQQRGGSIEASIPIGPPAGAAEEEAQRVSTDLGGSTRESSRTQLQRQPTPQCVRLIRAPGASDPLTGIAVQNEIRSHFRRRVGNPVDVTIPDASAGPLRTEGRGGVIVPQRGGGPRQGVGTIDLAYRRRRGVVLLVAEIKPASWWGLTFAEEQLLNYISKGNSADNAEFRRALGVRVVSPMTRRTYVPPRSVSLGGRQYRVMWCGVGVIVYKHVERRRRRRRRGDRRRERRETADRRRRRTQRRRARRARPRGGSAGVANFGFGLSILSAGAGAGNAGVGISINSQGASVGTVGGGVVYNSQGVAIGAIGAGAAVESEAAAAGVAGAGVSRESATAAAGAAGAGRSERTTAAGAGVAGTGSARDVTGAAAGQARSGTAEGARSGARGAGTGPGGGAPAGSRPGGTTGIQGGARAAEGEGTSAGSGRAGSTARAAGGAGGRLDEIVARLRLEIPESDPSRVRRAVVDAARLDTLVSRANPAQLRLLRLLAASSANREYLVPAPEWIQMILQATAGISAEDLEYLASLEWEPAHTTLEQLREAIRKALAARRSAAAPAPPQAPRGGAEPGSERQGAAEAAVPAPARRRRRTGGRRSGLRSISARRVFAALRATDWSGIAAGQFIVRLDRRPALLCGKTDTGTRWGAFVQPGWIARRGQRIQVVKDASPVVLLDNAVQGDSIAFVSETGEQQFMYLYGGGGGFTAGEAIDGGGILINLIVH